MNRERNLPFLLSLSVLTVFFLIKTAILAGVFESSPITRSIEYICFLSFIPFFRLIVKDLVLKSKYLKNQNEYSSKLNSSLIWQARNESFYSGDIKSASKSITREITVTIDTDRASIWIYNENKKSIVCQNLYVSKENKFYSGTELKEEDFPEYFEYLRNDPVIAATDAEKNPATSCFKNSYLKPLGIKSVLDVPIWYKGSVIGVICMESLERREWKDEEIAYSQILSSLYSFGYSVRESVVQEKRNRDLQKFIDAAALVTTADENGKIKYVNNRFTEVSGWTLEEALDKDHKIVNSGIHPKEFWTSMYRKVLNGEIWNSIVTNKSKDGKIYHVDTYIKASFNEFGKLTGFSSIRQDVTEIIKSKDEIEKKNTYLEHAAKIIRHDMHSGINTYIPRGISSLERRLSEDRIRDLKIEAPLKMIKEGLKHTQKVYKGVYEFTNLVKKESVLDRQMCNLYVILDEYLKSTAYRSQVIINDLGFAFVNDPLFCTALDNLIRNGLKYNDSLSKIVKVRREGDTLYVEDNGRGMSQDEFKVLSQPYKRKENQKESGTGLGLNICIAILEEHGFKIYCSKLPEGGTQIKIDIKK